MCIRDRRYTVFLQAGSSTFSVPLVDNLDKTYIDPYTFEPDTTYYWKVIATDTLGARYESAIWSFRTEPIITVPDVNQMVRIPGGYFMMGCDASSSRWHPCLGREFPLRQVWIDDFEIDKYEVTNSEYRACAAAGRCRSPLQSNSNRRDNYYQNAEFANYPVLYISHSDAEDFCRWEGKRLPTEAEWEKAARGPVDTREWPWGNEYPDCTRLTYEDSRDPNNWIICTGDTVRVGSYPRGTSPYGVMDMSGNVFEWVHDRYNIFYYQYSPVVNPQGPNESWTDAGAGPTSIPYFTIRGGSYRQTWFYPRVTHRHWGHKGPEGTSHDDVPNFRNNYVGFRCAR